MRNSFRCTGRACHCVLTDSMGCSIGNPITPLTSPDKELMANILPLLDAFSSFFSIYLTGTLSVGLHEDIFKLLYLIKTPE